RRLALRARHEVHGRRPRRASRGRLPAPGRALVVVGEDVLRRSLEVVELAALQRAPEDPADHENEGDGQGYEEVEAFHGVLGSSGRSALTRTVRELAPIATAASHGPIQPIAASGMAAAL